MLCCSAMHPSFLICLQKEVKYNERAGLYVTPYTLEITPLAIYKAKLSLILNSALMYVDTNLIDVSTRILSFLWGPCRFGSSSGEVGGSCLAECSNKARVLKRM